MLDDLRYSLRFFHVARTLARYGALFPLEVMDMPRPVVSLARLFSIRRRGLEGRPGQRLAEALEELGPSFIKMGQGLATRPDFLGEEVAADLAALQDKLPPFPAEEAIATIETEFGRPLTELFSEFERKPVAAASIAQVHFATTVDGRKVAVKVLRPDVEARFESDLKGFLWLAELMERRVPDLRRLRPVEVVKVLAETVRSEMDLRLEAAASTELAEAMAGFEGYRLPAPDWDRTSKRVLTLERVEGVPLSNLPAVRHAGHDPKRLAAVVVQAFLWQSMRQGFFHADVHPGNLFADGEGQIVAIDFGIMGRLDKDTRRYLAQILLGISNRDYLGVARLHVEAGYVPRHRSVEAFAQALRTVAEPIVGKPVSEISFGRMLGQLFAITRAFDMQTQPQLLLLQKSMVMVEGVAQSLDPDINMWETARPVLEDWARRQAGVEARLEEGIVLMRQISRDLPRALERLANGPLAVQEGTDVSGLVREVKKLHRRVLFLALAALAVCAISLFIG